MNQKFQAFQDFLSSQSAQVPLFTFLLDLILAAAFSYLLSYCYVRYGASLSNRKMFARHFLLLGMTTTLVIAIIKSSLALSLGLVGALSIVRFRAAIKEPEELMYLFLTIAVGLGFGASQRVVTIAALAVIMAVLWIRQRFARGMNLENVYLTVTAQNPDGSLLDNLVSECRKQCDEVSLIRFEDSPSRLQAYFAVGLQDYAQIDRLRKAVRTLDESLHVSVLDARHTVAS